MIIVMTGMGVVITNVSIKDKQLGLVSFTFVG